VKYGAFAYLLGLSRVGGLIVGAAMSRLNNGHSYPFVSDLTKIADLVCEMDHTLGAGRLPDPVYAVTHRRHARLANSRDTPQPVRCRQHEACGPDGPAGRLVLVTDNRLARYFPEAAVGRRLAPSCHRHRRIPGACLLRHGARRHRRGRPTRHAMRNICAGVPEVTA
jgi:hypothetical protein